MVKEYKDLKALLLARFDNLPMKYQVYKGHQLPSEDELCQFLNALGDHQIALLFNVMWLNGNKYTFEE